MNSSQGRTPTTLLLAPCPLPLIPLPLIFLILILDSTTVSQARNWSFDPGLSISETYSDNINVAPDGFEQSDFVTQINPTIKAELNGRRVKGNVNYRMQNFLYADNSDDNTTFHQYVARGNAELLLKHFFVDAASTLTQRIVDTRGVRVPNNYSIVGNRTDQLTFAVRPYWRHELGSYAEAQVHYEYGFVDFDDDKVKGRISDSDLNNISLSMKNLDDEDRLSWEVRYGNQHINYKDEAFDSQRFQRGGLILDYGLIHNFHLIGLGGYEDNDFGARLFTTTPTGPFWAVGFRWEPSLRSKLEAFFGDRFFGNTYRVLWEQRSRYLTTELSYTEDLGGEASFALENVSLIDDPTYFPGIGLSVTSDVFLRKLLSATVHFEKSKTTLVIRPFFEKREFEQSIEDEETFGVDSSWDWRLTARTTLAFRLLWQRLKFSDTNQKDDFIYATAGVRRQLSPRILGTLEYTHTISDTDAPLLEYTENAITLTLTRTF
jgi:uncharacterized protein (PEP-CTERM system associated)